MTGDDEFRCPFADLCLMGIDLNAEETIESCLDGLEHLGTWSCDGVPKFSIRSHGFGALLVAVPGAHLRACFA